MPKSFYTERDIVDMVNQGIQSLVVDDDVVLTDLAYEKARSLGMELLRRNDKPPAAPERPYIAKQKLAPAPASPPPAPVEHKTTPGSAATPAPKKSGSDDMHTRVREAVIARLGDSVDSDLLDTIIQRVLKSINTS